MKRKKNTFCGHSVHLLSVTQYQWLNCSMNFNQIWYRCHLQKLFSNNELHENQHNESHLLKGLNESLPMLSIFLNWFGRNWYRSPHKAIAESWVCENCGSKNHTLLQAVNKLLPYFLHSSFNLDKIGYRIMRYAKAEHTVLYLFCTFDIYYPI